MNTEQLWDKFLKSGSIDDYLKYIDEKGSCNDNS